MAKRNRVVLAIGDSHGAAADGWAVWLRRMVKADKFINNSRGGRTLGFDNPDERSNGLVNVIEYMNEAVTEAAEGVDDVVIVLGTNDCKACFDNRLGEVEGNLKKMVERIRKHDNGGKWSPRVVIVSPPPYGRDENMLEKYAGGAARAKALSAVYKRVSEEMHTKFADAHAALEPEWDKLSTDGVHLTSQGYKLLAETIAKVM